jgi:hypothetical protein
MAVAGTHRGGGSGSQRRTGSLVAVVTDPRDFPSTYETHLQF